MPLVRPATYWVATSPTSSTTYWRYLPTNEAWTTASTAAWNPQPILWSTLSMTADEWRIVRCAERGSYSEQMRQFNETQAVALANQQKALARANRNKVAAARRARELLLSFLDDVQRVEFRETSSFTFLGQRGLYRIEHGRIANISVLAPGGRELRRLCVHPENSELPIEDVMLSQLLHLRSDEEGLVRRANVHPARHAA